jgi:hypothetical protein
LIDRSICRFITSELSIDRSIDPPIHNISELPIDRSADSSHLGATESIELPIRRSDSPDCDGNYKSNSTKLPTKHKQVNPLDISISKSISISFYFKVYFNFIQFQSLFQSHSISKSISSSFYFKVYFNFILFQSLFQFHSPLLSVSVSCISVPDSSHSSLGHGESFTCFHNPNFPFELRC